MRTCSIDGCEKPHYGRGWCSMHYSRWRRTGDLSAPVKPTPPSPEALLAEMQTAYAEASGR